MTAEITAVFEIDVTDWIKEDGQKHVVEELHDFSVFIPMFEYSAFKKVSIKIL